MNSEILVPAFPRELLSASLAERLIYFQETAVVDHPSLTTHLERLLVLSAHPTSRNLVLVIGPTGAGKSSLLKRLNQRIRTRLTAAAKAAGQIGSVYVELEPPNKGSFDFQTLHRAALIDMKAPLVDRTRPIVHREVDGARIPTLLVERDVSALRGEALRTRFYDELSKRKALALILDEANAIFTIGKPKDEDDRLSRLKTQADLVKAMANATKSTVFLGGAYDFFDASISSGQNVRRMLIIHVKPYDNTAEGIAGFATAITGLLAHLPIVHSIDPATAATELFLQALRCVGTAAGILGEALLEAIETNSELSMEMVRKYYYPASALETMRREMEEGMKRVDALVAMEELAQNCTAEASNSSPPAPGADPSHVSTNTRQRLKPGDTKPSHMADKREAW